jgi:ABC-type polysaccharide/polyol phosphate transport system ATPase subunit
VAPIFDLGIGMDPETTGYENIIIRGLFLMIASLRIGITRVPVTV